MSGTMEKDTRTEEERQKCDVVYAMGIVQVTKTPGYEWPCPACGQGLRIFHPEAVQILSKGGKIPVNECGNPDCNGPIKPYNVGRQLMVQATPGMKAKVKRLGPALAKANGNGNLIKG